MKRSVNLSQEIVAIFPRHVALLFVKSFGRVDVIHDLLTRLDEVGLAFTGLNIGEGFKVRTGQPSRVLRKVYVPKFVRGLGPKLCKRRGV